MLQAAGLPVGARVGELVDLARALAPAPLTRDAVLGRAGLVPLAGRRVDTLSGGETQRVRFAMAIAGDPDLVFLDEPTVAMDVESRRAFWDDMRRSAAEGRTVLFATHYLDEADQVADRIVVLDHGRVVADGSPATLKASVREQTVRFVLGGDVAADRAAACRPAGRRRRDPPRRRRSPSPAGTPTRRFARSSPRTSRSATSRSRAPTWMPRSSPSPHLPHPPEPPPDGGSKEIPTMLAIPATTGRRAVPALQPFLAYLRLELRRATRNRRYLVMTVVFPVVIYVLYTAIIPAAASDQTVGGLTWPVYFLVSMAAYGAIGAAMIAVYRT